MTTTTTNATTPLQGLLESRLVTSFRTSLTALEQAWKQVGLSPAEQKEQLEALLSDFDAVLKRKVQTETALFEEYQTEVARLKEDIGIVAKRVGAVGPAPVEAPLADRVSLVRELTWLRGQYERLDAQRLAMQTGAEESMLRCHAVWGEMGLKPEPGFEEVGFNLVGRKEAFEAKLQGLSSERAKRAQEVRAASRAAAALLEELEVDVSQREFDRAIASQDERALGLSKEVLDAIALRTMELQKIKDERTATLQALGVRIQPLWERLGVSPAERQAFFDRNTGLGDRVVAACQGELERLLTLKRERMADFITAARTQILAALDECRASTSDRARLASLVGEPVNAEDLDASEALLGRHEAELARLNAVLEDLRPIVRSAARYVVLCRERTEYESLVQDSSRLLDRKRGAASLREEEMMRKRVTTELPKLVSTLEASVGEFERKHGGGRLCLPDVVGEDVPLVEYVKKTEKEHADRVAREKEQRARDKASSSTVAGAVAGKKPVAAATAAGPRVPLGVANRPKN